MSVNVLPDMDEPRMKYLGNQLNRSRKTSLIELGKMKSSLDIYVKSVDKSEKREHGKYQLMGMRLKKRLARVRGTQKVLKTRREESFLKYPDSDFPFGVYEGEKLESYRREVDDIIEKKHPKYRRQKAVEQHLREGKMNGRLLDNNVAKMEFEDIMTQGYRSKVKRNIYLRRENPLSQTFFKDTKKYFGAQIPRDLRDIYIPTGKHGALTPVTPRTAGTPVTPVTPLNTKGRQSRTSDTGSVESTGLTLPAITVSKAFVKKKMKTPNKLSLPNLAIRRATKCSAMSEPRHLAKDLSHFKGRRATTFM